MYYGTAYGMNHYGSQAPKGDSAVPPAKAQPETPKAPIAPAPVTQQSAPKQAEYNPNDIFSQIGEALRQMNGGGGGGNALIEAYKQHPAWQQPMSGKPGGNPMWMYLGQQ